MQLIRSAAFALALAATLSASASQPGETVFTFDTPADDLALVEVVGGNSIVIYAPSPNGGLADSGSLQWRTGNRVASRHPATLRIDGARPVRLSLSFLVFEAESSGGQPLALGVRTSAEGAPEFGRAPSAANAGYRLGLLAVESGIYRLVLANLPVGGGVQASGQTSVLAPGNWYRLEVESTPVGPHKVDLVGRLVSLDAWGKPTGVLDEVSLKGVANAELLSSSQLVPWFGGQSGALRGIATVDNFSVSNK